MAVNPDEISRLKDLYARATQNNVPNLKFLHSLDEIKKYEPHCEVRASDGNYSSVDLAFSHEKNIFKKLVLTSV